MPDLPKILLLDMDFLFFPIVYSNSMPKTYTQSLQQTSVKFHKLLMVDGVSVE